MGVFICDKLVDMFMLPESERPTLLAPLCLLLVRSIMCSCQAGPQAKHPGSETAELTVLAARKVKC